MRPKHPEIAEKAFDFTAIDHRFDEFATDHCNGHSPAQLLADVWGRIVFDHDLASPVQNPGTPVLWEISTEHLVAFYLVTDSVVSITWLLSKQTGQYYQSERLPFLLG